MDLNIYTSIDKFNATFLLFNSSLSPNTSVRLILSFFLFSLYIQTKSQLSLSLSISFCFFSREIPQSVLLFPQHNQQCCTTASILVWYLCPRFLNGIQGRLCNYENAISYLGCTHTLSPIPETS